MILSDLKFFRQFYDTAYATLLSSFFGWRISIAEPAGEDMKG